MTKGMALIEFQVVAIEDRAESNAKGHWVGRDIDVCFITPVGGRHTHEKEVTPELLREWKASQEFNYRYEAYQAWKEGAEPPVNGSPLKNWPPISPAKLKQFNARNIRSVEELAEIPDEYLPSFGPDTRIIRDKAREWIKSSSDIGQVVSELAILKEELAKIRESDAKKANLIEQLLERLGEEDESPKRGRPKKVA